MQKIQDLELFAQVIAKTADVICSCYCLSESFETACRTLIFALSTNHSLSGHVLTVAVSDASTLRKTLRITVSVMSRCLQGREVSPGRISILSS